MKGRSTQKYSGFLILVSLSCIIGYITYGSLPDISIISRIQQQYRSIRKFAGVRIKDLAGNVSAVNYNLQSDLITGRYVNKSGIRQATSQSTTSSSKGYTVQNSSGIQTENSSKTKTTNQSSNQVQQKVNIETAMKKALSRRWQPCGTGRDVFVYSAYYGPEEHDVRVVGIARRKANRSAIICTYPRESEFEGVNATIEILPDHQGLKSSAVLMSCSLKHNNTLRPEVLAIKLSSTVTYLKVLYPQARRHNFTVCVACLHGPYRDYSRLIEMVETDQTFGADHFVFYNHSISPMVNKVLDHYVGQGTVEVQSWGSPRVAVHYYAQMAQVQDCILASRGVSKYLVVKDLDEVLVPNKHKNWHELMNFLDIGAGKNATFIFRNSFFEFNVRNVTQPKPVSGSPNIKSLMYVWRDKRFFLNKVRSKVILRPEFVEIGGIHFSWKDKLRYTSHAVDTEVAYLHHYRNFDGYRSKVKDTRMLDFSDVLIQHINRTYSRLGIKL